MTGDDVEKVALFNEYGLKVSTRDLVRTDNGDGTVTWTFRTAIGTVGTGRVLTLAVAADGQYTLTDAAFTVDVKAVKPVVVSATIEETAVVNEPVTLTVVTGKEVRKLEIRNEFGLKMGILSSAYQDMDGNRVWTVQTKIGTRGVRQFTVSGKNAYGDVSDAVTTNPVTVRAF